MGIYIPRATPPSIKLGYAREKSQSQSPEQWNGLLASWKPSLGIDGAANIFDVSGFANSGVLTNMDISNWVVSDNPKLPGYVLSLNGSNEYIDFPSLGSFDTIVGGSTNSFTVSLWAKTNVSSRQSIIADWNGSGNNNSFWMGFGGYTVAPGDFGAGFDGSAIIDTHFGYSTGVWYYLTVTYDTVTNTLTFYIDGVSRGTLSDAWGDTGTNMTIGRGGNYSATYTNGFIDDIRIYDYALSPSAVLDIYRDPNAMYRLEDRFAFLATEAPVGVTVSPAAQTLALTLPVPTVLINELVTPAAQTLSLSLPVPTIAINELVLLPVQGLSLSLPVPTVLIDEIVTLPVQTLALTLPVPTVLINELVTPAAQTLSLSLPVPTINITNNITVQLPALTMSLAQPVPIISIDIKVIISGPLTMALSQPVPVISFPITVVISSALSLTLAQPVPTISAGVVVPISIRKQIVAAIIAQLKTITTANGYNTEIGTSVKDWQVVNIPLTDLPMIEINDTDEASEIKGQYHYNILTIEVIGKIATADIDDARNLQKDIVEAMVERPVFPSSVYHFLPAQKTKLLSEKTDRQVVSITLNYEIKYREKLL